MLDVPIIEEYTIDAVEGSGMSKANARCKTAPYSVRLILDFSPHDWSIFSKSELYQELEVMLGHVKSTNG